MKKLCTFAVILALAGGAFFLLEGCKEKKTAFLPGKSSSGGITSAEPNSFQEVTSKLDQGGNLFVYLSTEQWLTNLSEKIGGWRDMVASMPDLQDQHAQVANAFAVGTNLIKDSGLENISGVGMSSIAREPGMYYNKLIVHHYAGQGDGFMWTLFGKEPHELTALNLLPANTAMAAFYDLDTAQLWDVIQKECEKSGFPEATDFLKTFPKEFEKGAGLKWDDAIGSLDGEFGLVITLDETKMVHIPMPNRQSLEIPEPAIMLVVKVKNDVIFNRLDAQIKKTAQRGMISVDKDGLKMRTVPIPMPLPVTLRPSVATGGGYLFISSSDALIQEAMAVKGGKAGLKSTDEFKKLATDIPDKGNQFCFLSQRFGTTIKKIQEETMSMNGQGSSPQMKQLLHSILSPGQAAFTYGVGANTDEGWMTVANGNQGGGNVLAASAVVPAVLAAVALPNFAKARATSRKNICINNLRMIDGAKQQWALENSKTQNDAPSWQDIQTYLGKGKTQLHCPDGGEYTIGAVGEPPTCTIPGHALPRN